MPPKKTTDGPAADATPVIFSTRDQQILLNAFMCMEAAPSINYEQLAARCGMTNPRSASNAWLAIRKKIIEHGNIPVIDSEGNTLPVMNPFSNSKRKASDDDEGTDGPASAKKTPAKRARPTPKKPAAAAENMNGEDGEEGDAAALATPTKAPRKRAAPKKAGTPKVAKLAPRVESDSEAEAIMKPTVTNEEILKEAAAFQTHSSVESGDAAGEI
ncbi:hypothetical protein B0T16DRAFT_388357 [Cercophora newfieldiana]|uniref:Uncharacterized protein n=1 Tax=Cercophora newfieldiana TaxID=92897 RepID=A0AA39Y9W7_9PEZI|nr:hypothetical protein B0T16DRAFT_388357 [Cercophora newfieldiana]